MNLNNYSFIILDSCFISNVNRIDDTCRLVDCFGLLSDSGCVIKQDQYNKGQCNHYCPQCIWLDDVFSDEDSLKANRDAKNLGINFSRISRDPADPKIFLWAKKTANSAVFTCDKNLLKLLSQYNIPRSCFKAAIKALDKRFDGAITDEYSLDIMQYGDNPFFHYSNNGCCNSHCEQTSSCECCKS